MTIKTSPFTYVTHMQQGKHLIRDSVIPKEQEHYYNPFITNKAHSFHYDSILYANDMNIYNGLDNMMQYDYYLGVLRTYKRPHKWYKAPKLDENIDIIANHYNINKKRAAEYLPLMSNDDIKIIKNKGGNNE